MGPPRRMPVGLLLSRSAKAVGRAFDAALDAAGGGLPSWLILLSLKTRTVANQRELAEAIGIRGATLTHHLNAMEADGLLTRRRDPHNRRIHQVTLTAEGEDLFRRLRDAAGAFDATLRAGLTEEDLAVFDRVLTTMARNVTDATGPDARPAS